MKRLMQLISVILLLFLLAACTEEDTGEGETEEEEKPITVEVAEVKEGNLIVEKSIFGRTEPNRSTPVMVTAPGEIDKLEVQNGDAVEKDDLIATIKTQMGNQNIRASEDGEIIGLKLKEGDMASAEEPLAIIADMDSVSIKASVTANLLDILAIDDTVTAKIEEKEYEATVVNVDQLPDDTGLYPVSFSIDEDGDIVPGLVSEIIITDEKVKSALIVPTASLVEEQEETFVYVVNGDQLKKVSVKTLNLQSKESAIEGDVKAGDQVVTSGQLNLSDGQQVEVLKGE